MKDICLETKLQLMASVDTPGGGWQEGWLSPVVRPESLPPPLDTVLYLLLGRKTMTNLDSMLKSRDITLPAKVHLVQAMFFFPVVMYGCESWTIKKAER